MNNRELKGLIILGIATVFTLLSLQVYWVYQSWKTEDTSFNQTAHIALRNVAQSLADFNGSDLPPKDLIKRLSTDYYVVNIDDVIDANVLEHYLTIEMNKHSLITDFEYGIYDCESDAMLYGSYCNLDNFDSKSEITQKLPKYDEFLYYFGVKFPTKSGYVLGNINFAILFSLITLLLTGFFIYSIFVIIRQRRLSELQKDFINNMTHEFKTPISSILLSSNVLLNDQKIQKDQRLLQYTNIIKDQNKRLNDQVEKVLNLAKTEKDHFKLNLEKLSLHQLINNTIQNSKPKIQEAKAAINFAPKAKEDIITADRLHLTNVLSNLIDNAIKYSSKNADIKIETSTIEDGLEIKVKDNGIGIAKDEQAKIFDKFYRVSTGDVHNVKGFGLGLFYVKNICNAHAWKLKLDSGLDQGTIVSIKIKQT